MDCAPYDRVEPTADWSSTAEQTFTVDDAYTTNTDVRQTGNMPTVGSVESKPPPPRPGRQGHRQGQDRIPDDSGPPSQNPDTPSIENDDTGDNMLNYECTHSLQLESTCQYRTCRPWHKVNYSKDWHGR